MASTMNYNSSDLKSHTKSFLRGFLRSEDSAEHAEQGLAYLKPLAKRKRKPAHKQKKPLPAGTELLKRVPPTAVRELDDINPFHKRPPKHGNMEQGHGVEWQSVFQEQTDVSQQMFRRNGGCQYQSVAKPPAVPPFVKPKSPRAPWGPPSCYDPEWRNFKTPAQTPHVGMEKQAGWWVQRDEQ